MSHSQTFRVVRLSAILLFILALVAIVISSGKQLIVTKRVEVPIEVEKVVEVPVYVSELNETDTNETFGTNNFNGEVETEEKLTARWVIDGILWILFAICLIAFLIFFALDDIGITTDKNNWEITFGALTLVFLLSATVLAAI